jgi:hypothetical protein
MIHGTRPRGQWPTPARQTLDGILVFVAGKAAPKGTTFIEITGSRSRRQACRSQYARADRTANRCCFTRDRASCTDPVAGPQARHRAPLASLRKRRTG